MTSKQDKIPATTNYDLLLHRSSWAQSSPGCSKAVGGSPKEANEDLQDIFAKKAQGKTVRKISFH